MPKFDELKAKYKLPEFKELDNEFELSSIEEENFYSRELRRSVVEKIDSMINFLHDLVQPDTTALNLYEARIFDEGEKIRIFEMLKQLMYYKRYSTELEIIAEEKLDCKFVSEFFGDWKIIKPELIKIAEKTKVSWKLADEKELRMEYFG